MGRASTADDGVMTIGAPTAKKLQLALLLLGIVALAVAAWDVATGGFYLTIAGMRVSSREAYKRFRLGMLALGAAIGLRDRVAEPGARSWERLPVWAPRIAAAIALVSLLVAIRLGIF